MADTLAKIEGDIEMAVKVADKKVIKNYLGVKMWSRACLTEGKGDGGDKVAVGSVTKIKSPNYLLSSNSVKNLFSTEVSPTCVSLKRLNQDCRG